MTEDQFDHFTDLGFQSFLTQMWIHLFLLSSVVLMQDLSPKRFSQPCERYCRNLARGLNSKLIYLNLKDMKCFGSTGLQRGVLTFSMSFLSVVPFLGNGDKQERQYSEAEDKVLHVSGFLFGRYISDLRGKLSPCKKNKFISAVKLFVHGQ